MQWYKINSKKQPLKYRMVLVAKDKDKVLPPCLVVGYRNSHGQFITPGSGSNGEIQYWCDCLGNDFSPPMWKMKQVENV